MTETQGVHTRPEHPSRPRISPHLFVAGAQDALAFYCTVFGAVERVRVREPDGRIGHAQLTVGDSLIMLAEEFPEHDMRGPRSVGGTPVAVSIHVDDVDEVFDRALAAGARTVLPVSDQLYGDRVGMLEDPFGHRWMVATRVEEVSLDELSERMPGAVQI
ncbi:VOC family protein [Streptomyces sp. NPDC058067]|uniref:VOC family protein n=1 Tax=Streptomyces sp. NPDC058067 TaxID=3346324 RepID=UPI0036EA8013